MLGFESGSYFICTETSPRCFVLQQMSGPAHNAGSGHALSGRQQPQAVLQDTQVHQQKDSQLPPSMPPAQPQSQSQPLMLPWWFTAECHQQLLNVPSFEAMAQQHASGVYASISRSATPEQMSMEQLRNRLKHQLEYYFSRENLINDRYLRCQMDADQYVLIKIVAGFPKVAQLTNNFDLIVDVLRSSSNVQVDDAGKKVRPVTKRCTIILRDIPENAAENDVKAMFDGCSHKFVSIAYGLNNSWYVTFEDEEATKSAFLHLKDLAFNDKPIHARIKTGNAPGNPSVVNSSSEFGQFAPTCVTPVPPAEKGDVVTSTSIGQLIVHDISHHYHNHSLHSHVVQQQQQNSRYIPIEIDTSLPSIVTTTAYGGRGLSPNSRRLSPTPTASVTLKVTSSLNLGLLLAQYGYVPRATFRPNLPPPGVVVSAPPPLPTVSTAIQPPVSPPPSTKTKATDEDKENKLFPTSERKKRLISEGSQLSAKSAKTTAAHSDPGVSSTAPPPSSPPDFGRQRITDVPRLNRDCCSPLMHGGRPTAGFLAGMNFVANEMLARVAAGGRTPDDSPALAFTDGTHLSTIIDPSTLLNGPQTFGNVITVSVDERPVSAIVVDQIMTENAKSDEKVGEATVWQEDFRRALLPQKANAKVVSDNFVTRTPSLETFDAASRPARPLGNRFNESDSSLRAPRSSFNKTNNNKSFNNSFRNGGEFNGRVFYSNHTARLPRHALSVFDSSATNPFFLASSALQPLSVAAASQRRLEYRSSHYDYRNPPADTFQPSPARRTIKRASLTAHDERQTFANTVANTLANGSVSFNTADVSAGFRLVDVEFPELANRKRQLANKSTVDGSAEGANGATRRRSSARVQFSAIVAGVNPHNNNNNKDEARFEKQQNTVSDNTNNINNNNDGTINLLSEKRSYAQTLKKVHR